MNVILIGAGNLATNLGKALKNAGHDILQVYSRTMESASALAQILGCEATCDVEKISDRADIYIFSVKDSVLEQLVSQVSKKKSGKVFLHTAGSMPMSIFEGKVSRYGVFYPMQTFSKTREVSFSEIPCLIEASDESTYHQVEQLARSVSSYVVGMSSADRKYLHLAAVWACNFANHCYDMASELLRQHGFAFDMMLPLIDETARKVHAMSPRQAQTGPAVRYDENMIEAQQELMKEMPLQREIYQLMSKSIHQVQQEKHKKHD